MTHLKDDLQRALGATYTVERELVGGGMSTVFVATDNALGRAVVVKVLPYELAQSVSVDRFKREIMLSAALQHPNIVPVLSAGEMDGLPYFVMPYVDGESLRTRIARGPLSVRETVAILRDVARALAYAHGRGVIHRDIKPDNILLSGGAAMVTDFGVAKAISASRERVARAATSVNSGGWNGGTITTAGTSLGTPAYMAPEQAAADPNTDHRADLYALGIVGYEMLVGAPPFYGRTPQALLAAQLTEPPPPIGSRRYDVPAALAELLARCLEKDAANRPRTAAEVARALEDPAVLGGDLVRAPQTRTRRRPRRWPLVVATLLAIVAAGGALVAVRAPVIFERAASPAAAPTTTARKSIVVMPLVNIGGDTSDVYFAEGMTTELTNALSRIAGLRVAAHTAATAARDRYTSIDEIGKALNVNMLLEGTVQRDRGRLRVTARLISVGDGLTLWSDMFEREVKDVFQVQDEISGAIVSAIAPELGPNRPSTAPASIRGTNDQEAYDLYLRGRFRFEKRGEGALRQALADFQEAVRRDSGFAKAYTGIADAYAELPSYSDVPIDSVLPLGLSAIDRAIMLDSAVAEAHAAKGKLLTMSWQWNGAEQEYRRAIALDPRYAAAHQWYGELLLLNGRLDEAAAELERATELDPLSAVASGSYGLALGAARRQELALSAARHALALDSTLLVSRFMAGTVYLYAGRLDEAVRQLQIASALDPKNTFTLAMLGYAYAAAGRTAEARSIVAELERSAGVRNGATAGAARVYLGLRDTARALTLLERAAREHDVSFSTEGLAEPLFDSVRHSTRFAGVIRRIGLDSRLIQ